MKCKSAIGYLFCKTCGWNLHRPPVGTKTPWGVTTEERPWYYNHAHCDTGEDETSVEVTA